MADPKVLEDEAKLYNQALAIGYLVRNGPFIPSQTNFATSMPKLATQFRGEFCWATCYDPEFAAELFYNGFLIMADRMQDVEILTPKLHIERSLVMLSELPAPHKSTVKKSKKFEVTVDTCFLDVAKGINEQHGPSWFWPNLVALYAKMNINWQLGWHGGRVRVHSFEVWKGDELVAGECGYSCGKVYTSLSGFTRESSAGTVQMYAMASHLTKLGFVVWDLGMHMGYKQEEFSARPYPRLRFLQILAEYRDQSITGTIRCADRTNAKIFLDYLRKGNRSIDDVEGD